MELGAQSTVDAEELLVHDCRQRQTTERLHAGLVYSLRVLVLALQLEGEVIGQMATLVVSAEKPKSLRIVNLERPEVEHAFYAKIAPINIVAQEEVSRLSRVATDFKELHQIVVLAVDVAADGDGGVHLKEVGLLAQNLGTLLDNP